MPAGFGGPWLCGAGVEGGGGGASSSESCGGLVRSHGGGWAARQGLKPSREVGAVPARERIGGMLLLSRGPPSAVTAQRSKHMCMCMWWAVSQSSYT